MLTGKSKVYYIDKVWSVPGTLEEDFSFHQACTRMHPTPENDTRQDVALYLIKLKEKEKRFLM